MLQTDERLHHPVGTAPRNWEQAVGYPGEARFVAFYWSPYGDEAIYSDGAISADGNWSVYQEVVDRRLALPAEQRNALGNSEEEATHYLVLDRETRHLYVAPRRQAQALLRQQHPPAPVRSLEEIQETYERAIALIKEARQQAQEELSQGVVPCWNCGMAGWIHARDGGFDQCPDCAGRGFITTRNTGEDR